MRIRQPGRYYQEHSFGPRPGTIVPVLGFSCDYAYSVSPRGLVTFFETDGRSANGQSQLLALIGPIDPSTLTQVQIDRLPD